MIITVIGVATISLILESQQAAYWYSNNIYYGWTVPNSWDYIIALLAVILVPAMIALAFYVQVLRQLDRASKIAREPPLSKSYTYFGWSAVAGAICGTVFLLLWFSFYFQTVIYLIPSNGDELYYINLVNMAILGPLALAIPGSVLIFKATKKVNEWAIQYASKNPTEIAQAIKKGTNKLNIAAIFAVSMPGVGIILGFVFFLIGLYLVGESLIKEFRGFPHTEVSPEGIAYFCYSCGEPIGDPLAQNCFKCGSMIYPSK